MTYQTFTNENGLAAVFASIQLPTAISTGAAAGEILLYPAAVPCLSRGYGLRTKGIINLWITSPSWKRAMMVDA